MKSDGGNKYKPKDTANKVEESGRREREKPTAIRKTQQQQEKWKSLRPSNKERLSDKRAQQQRDNEESKVLRQQQETQTEAEEEQEVSVEEPQPQPQPEERVTALQRQLQYLAQLPEQDFEKDFRTWMTQEGIARELHAHLRMDLINSFNGTSLGQQLQLLSNSGAGVVGGGGGSIQQQYLLLSPLSLALNTLVAEFLHAQNCHYTLSVFCSETPHRHTLPDFDGRPAFRFRDAELQDVLAAVLGFSAESAPALATLRQRVAGSYQDCRQSLLFATLQALVDAYCARQRGVAQAGTMTEAPAPTPPRRRHHRHRQTQTQTLSQPQTPTTPPPTRPQVNCSQLQQAEDIVVGADGRSTFIGPRITQSLRQVERQLMSLLRQLQQLAKSCGPPVEVISPQALEQLLESGQQTVTAPPAPPAESPPHPQTSNMSSSLGAIQLPMESAAVPRLPSLHPEQLHSLSLVRQVLERLQRREEPQLQLTMNNSLARTETLLGEICGCVQALSNVLNCAMEQEHDVGCHKGFKRGYKQGFDHGHFMGMQEGQRIAAAVSTDVHHVATQTKQEAKEEIRSRTRTQRDAAVQTPPLLAAEKSYDHWIYEMLHTSSGQVFLERVELSLNKALELQKQRLDELYDIKLRHHTEMLRLSQRQSSWRTLCRRVERDTSGEARHLVHKIFRLLEHYEAHHQALVEKIQETELAAEQAARVLPVWGASAWSTRPSDAATAPAAPSPAVTSTTETSTSTTPVPEERRWNLPQERVPPPSAQAQTQPQPPQLYPQQPLALPYQLVPIAVAALPPTAAAPVPTVVPTPVKPPMYSVATNTRNEPEPVPVPDPAPAIASLPPRPKVQPQAQRNFDEVLLSAKGRMLQLEQESELLEQSFLNYMDHARVQKDIAQRATRNIRASCARERRQINETLDSFRDWHRRCWHDDAAVGSHQAKRSNMKEAGEAAILSQLSLSEQEDTPSYQFTNAISVARRKLFAELNVSPGAVNPTKQRPRSAEQSLSLGQFMANREVVWSRQDQLLSQVEAQLAELDDTAANTSYEPDMQWPTKQPPAEQAGLLAEALPCSEDSSSAAGGGDSLDNGSTSTATPMPAARVETGAGDAGSSVPEAAMANGGSTQSPANRKLQRSMARMQLLFSSQEPPEPLPRPVSAPASKSDGWPEPPPRPRTAPATAAFNLITSAAPVAPASPLALDLEAYMEALSAGNTTANSSSLESSLRCASNDMRAQRAAYVQLVSHCSAIGAPTLPQSSRGLDTSPELSHSQEFWQRMNI